MPVEERLGLTVPHEWWAAPALLKSFEAAGFRWVQLDAPPASVLSVPRHCVAHASGAASSLATTELRPILHAPRGLRVGTRAEDRAFEGLLSYAAEIGASAVVYHALALPNQPESADPLLSEGRSLAALAALAERLGVTIAIENLAPLYPGPETVSASPLSLRGLAHRIGSARVGVCLDLGHAHVIADGRHTSLTGLIEPVLDVVALFHVHDNLGSRRVAGEGDGGVDPLRLDLHLPPGRGTLPWAEVAPLLERAAAPLVLEIHPPRPGPEELYRDAVELLSQPASVEAKA